MELRNSFPHILFPILLATIVVCYDAPVFSDESSIKECQDLDPKCSVWASQGECQSNAAWMMGNCRRSCQSCQGGLKAWQLRTHIAKVYDNSSNTKTGKHKINRVNIETVKINHITLNEKEETMSIHGKIVQSWQDSRVEWDDVKWGVAWLNFYWIQIWTPQLIQVDGVTSSPGVVEGRELAANYTGLVFSWSDFSFTSACPFNYGAYPNDLQSCCFRIDSKKYFTVTMTVGDKAEMYGKESAMKSHLTGWTVEDMTVKPNKYKVDIRRDWRSDPTSVETNNVDICVAVRRNAAYYSTEIVGPAIATVVITLSSFIVGSFWNQVVLIVTSIFMQILSMLLISNRLPPTTSSVPAVVKFAGFNLAMTLILLVIILVLLNFACTTSDIPPPRCLDQIVSLLSRVLPCLKVEVDETKLGDAANGDMKGAMESSSKGLHWLPLCRVIKYVTFVVYIALYILVLIATFAA